MRISKSVNQKIQCQFKVVNKKVLELILKDDHGCFKERALTFKNIFNVNKQNLNDKRAYPKFTNYIQFL